MKDLLEDSARAHSGEWRGSTDPDDTGGVATFRVDGMAISYAIHLDSFTSFQLVHNLLDIAFAQGKRRAMRTIRAKIMRMMDEAE